MHKICCFSICASFLFCSHDGGIVVQDTHDEFGHSYLLLRCLRLFCILVAPYALSPVDFHLCLYLYCITLQTCTLLYLNTTWYFHPGLADCRQACIYASILDHWLLSDCSLSVHKCIVKILAQLWSVILFPKVFFFPGRRNFTSFLNRCLGRGVGTCGKCPPMYTTAFNIPETSSCLGDDS